ncbi:MAG: iron uptake transporter deferrochelatase/peroxidase subunit [Nocardiaceae bacterium]|nr:iron uptake transporter deferrochelatase/peroxidase subunit [Nocardiaceae bacterium]
MSETTTRRAVSRRSLLVGGAGVVGIGAAAGIGFAAGTKEAGAAVADLQYSFDGAHQAGIITPAQDHLHFASWDLTTTSRDDVIAMLQEWTAAARRMTTGAAAGKIGPVDGPAVAPPDDTGEAMDLPASGLTITFGFGPSFFDKLKLTNKPKLLADLPHFPQDVLDPNRVGGDLCVQACANDPQVAVHAIRNLARIAFGTAAIKWAQLGYGRTSSTSTAQMTPRNLFGFKDGTANLKAEEGSELAKHVWVDADDDANAAWLAGGTYLIARRIRMSIEIWDRTPLGEQETIVGRFKGNGAPLSGGEEFTDPDFAAQQDGKEKIGKISHVAIAHPKFNDGHRILRRGYNFTDGADGLGKLDAGLFFLGFVRNPATQYIPLQTKMSRDDVMMEYLKHTGSGIWAIPRGVTGNRYIGQELFTG